MRIKRVTGLVVSSILTLGSTNTVLALDSRTAATATLETRGAAWWNGFGAPPGQGLGSSVNAMIVSGGVLYVGGDFTQMGTDLAANRIARWNGTAWQRVGGGVNHRVFALTEFNGHIVAGGAFYHAGNVFANHVAEWDGSAWSALGGGLPDDVYALEVFQGQLIAAGKFGVRQWNGAAWTPLPGAPSGPTIVVEALEVHAGSLIIGGFFSNVGFAQYTTNIARYDGSFWSGLEGGINGEASGAVTALLSRGDSLFVGGFFTSVNDTANFQTVSLPASRIVLWDETPTTPGAHWVPAAFGAGTSGGVLAFADFGGALAVGGQFATVGGALSASRIATWSNGTWSALGSGMGGALYAPDVRALSGYTADLYAGGWFTTAGGTPSQFIARWTASVGDPTAVALVPQLDVAGATMRIGPNPFSKTTRLAMSVPGGAADARLTVYDVMGRAVRRLYGGPIPEQWSVDWDGRSDAGNSVPAGIYFVRAEVGSGQPSVKPVVLVR